MNFPESFLGCFWVLRRDLVLRIPTNLSANLLANLRSDACAEILNTHNRALGAIAQHRPPSSQIEAWLTGFLCIGIGPLAVAWRTHFQQAGIGLGLNLASVFTHQTPHVRSRTNGARCELADLLLAVIDRTSVPPQGIAALIQAKIPYQGQVRLTSPSEMDQFDLLSLRPVFDLVTPNAPSGIDLTQLQPDVGLMYGLTNDTATPQISPWRCHYRWATTHNLMAIQRQYCVQPMDCLAYTLVGMLISSYGWPFKLPSLGLNWRHLNAMSPRDDWSVLINYLLEETFSKALSPKLQSVTAQGTRGSEHRICLRTVGPDGRTIYSLTDGLDSTLESLWQINYPLQQTSQRIDADTLGELLSVDNGGSFDNEVPHIGEYPDENGGISAIVFEIVNHD